MESPQNKTIIGYDQDYPGSYRWPIYSILCPHCNKDKTDYENIEVNINNQWYYVCTDCEERINVEEKDSPSYFV